MKRNIKKIITLCLCMIVMSSMSLMSYATTVNHELTVTENHVRAAFTYGNGGNVLQLRLDYTEKHTQTNQVYSNYVSNVAYGMDKTVVAQKYADTGYRFTLASSKATVGNTVYNEILNVEP